MNKIATSLLLITACGVVFLVVNTVHFQYLPVHVVLYDAMLDAAFAVAITGIGLVAIRHGFRSLSSLELGLSLAVAGLLCAPYAVLGPAIIDRSLSMYLLETVKMFADDAIAAGFKLRPAALAGLPKRGTRDNLHS